MCMYNYSPRVHFFQRYDGKEKIQSEDRDISFLIFLKLKDYSFFLHTSHFRLYESEAISAHTGSNFLAMRYFGLKKDGDFVKSWWSGFVAQLKVTAENVITVNIKVWHNGQSLITIIHDESSPLILFQSVLYCSDTSLAN